MDLSQAEALRKELGQLLRKQTEVLESRTFGVATDADILEYEDQTRSFTKCAINSPIRTRQREGSRSPMHPARKKSRLSANGSAANQFGDRNILQAKTLETPEAANTSAREAQNKQTTLSCIPPWRHRAKTMSAH